MAGNTNDSPLFMNFDQFSSAIIHMSQVAFTHRTLPMTTSAIQKINALLLHMWKAVNDYEQFISGALISSKHNTDNAITGNSFGAGLFSQSFLSKWQKDGFPDYVAFGIDGVDASCRDSSKSSRTSSPSKRLNQSISFQERVSSSDLFHSIEQSILSSPISSKDKAFESPQIKFLISSIKNRSQDSTQIYTAGLGYTTSPDKLIQLNQTLVIDNKNLSTLLKQRPELVEFLYSEIQVMKTDEG